MKHLLCLPVAAAIFGCSSNAGLSAQSCPLGERLHGEVLRGTIYGSVSTKITLPNCHLEKIGIAFVGRPDAKFGELADQASNTLEEISFDAVADGYLVRDNGRYILLAVSLEKVTSVVKGDTRATPKMNPNGRSN